VLDLGPGLYSLSLIVQLDGRSVSVKRSVVVKTSVTIQDVKLGISQSKKMADATVYPIGHQQGLATDVGASSTEGDFVILEFSVSPASLAPHQAFVRLTHLESALDTFFTAKGKEGSFSVGVSLAEEAEKLLQQSGEYQVSILVGDPVYEKAAEFAVGTLSLSFPVKVKPQFPIYTRPLLYDSDNALAPLPEIKHQFRQPERLPNPIIPTVFTSLIIGCFVVFIALMQRVGANLKGFPDGVGAFWSMALFASIVSILLLFTAYWLYLKAFTTLKYLSVLGVVTVFTGHRAFIASYAQKSPSS
jgi:oligosaccharyltransferase complex subunit delta (ribophorin II)